MPLALALAARMSAVARGPVCHRIPVWRAGFDGDGSAEIASEGKLSADSSAASRPPVVDERCGAFTPMRSASRVGRTFGVRLHADPRWERAQPLADCRPRTCRYRQGDYSSGRGRREHRVPASAEAHAHPAAVRRCSGGRNPSERGCMPARFVLPTVSGAKSRAADDAQSERAQSLRWLTPVKISSRSVLRPHRTFDRRKRRRCDHGVAQLLRETGVGTAFDGDPIRNISAADLLDRGDVE